MSELCYKLTTNDSEIQKVFELRKKVFVEEQGVAESLEFDGKDEQALHMVAMDGEQIVGTARVLFLDANQAKLERMAVLKPFRRKGIGSRLISCLNEDLSKRQVKQVVLHAQYSVIDFYRSCGFEETGSPFWEAGIKHIKMQKPL
jgi:predicted GNAT family N-acyltransferase